MSTNRELRINDFLGKRGLATLDNPGALVAQLGTLVRDHMHYQILLAACAPSERRIMYEALSPYLRFRPYPLDMYIAAAGQKAEREQQPTIDEDGKFHAFRIPEIKSEGSD